MKTFFEKHVLKRGDEYTNIEIEYTATPIISAVMPSLNDPGCPAEGGDIEVVAVTTSDGKKVDLTNGEENDLIAWLLETHDYDDDYDDSNDRYDE